MPVCSEGIGRDNNIQFELHTKEWKYTSDISSLCVFAKNKPTSKVLFGKAPVSKTFQNRVI